MENNIKVLNVIDAGGIGGIETLCMNAASYSRNDNSYLFLWKPGEISEEMINRGYKVQVLNTSIRNYMKDSIKVAKICKDNGYDVVVFHGINPMVALCTVWIRIICSGTKIVSYVHNNPSEWKMRYKMSARVIFACAKKVICISDSVLHSTENTIGYRKKLVRIYNGVDLKKFNNKNKRKAVGNKLIYVGRLAENKGVDIILRALAKVKCDFRFDIIGDGVCRPELEKLSYDLCLNDKVFFQGKRTNIPEYLSSADIFIHVPTLEEGFGITVVEAMASGLLCICSKSGGLNEIIEDGVTGYLVDKNAPEELARVIQSSLENYDSEEIREIKNNARNKAMAYSINNYVAELDGLVNEISERGVKLIYVGRLQKVKGVQNIISSLSEISDIQYNLRIVGDGSYRNELEKLSQNLGIKDKVEFLGARRDIPDLLWDSDVFVHLPEWQEGFGITVIEAMAAGKICIVNDHGALPEIITDGVDGYVVKEGVRDFKNTISEIYNEILAKDKSQKIRDLQSRAVKRAQEFSIEKYAKAVDDLVLNTVLK